MKIVCSVTQGSLLVSVLNAMQRDKLTRHSSYIEITFNGSMVLELKKIIFMQNYYSQKNGNNPHTGIPKVKSPPKTWIKIRSAKRWKSKELLFVV